MLIALREVKKLWGEYIGLGQQLFIPESKRKEIMKNFPDAEDQKKAAISYWISNDPLASWRRLIVVLDGMGKIKLADSIRPNAETVTGKSLYMKTHTCSTHTLWLTLGFTVQLEGFTIKYHNNNASHEQAPREIENMKTHVARWKQFHENRKMGIK